MSDRPEIERISGSPTPEEERAIADAIAKMFDEEVRVDQPSAWKYAGRTSGLRLGVTEIRHRLGPRSWRVSERLSWEGEPTSERQGRGETK